tara:strand:+ start:6464 stop:7153 length:690 start_codon:yes stop_codon:yes gene_type:complete
MKFYCLICTRSYEASPVLNDLISYLSRGEVETKLLVNQESLFSAYDKGVKTIEPDDDDIIIMCHDDIEILTEVEDFKDILDKNLDEEAGFVGVAGTEDFGFPCVWWDHTKWKEGKHSGWIEHEEKGKGRYSTDYGPHRQVAVLDGVFLAARGKVLKELDLKKPSIFEGNWDFYDIYYTTEAHILGYKNKTVEIKMCHKSIGDTDGRESWHANRLAYYMKYKNVLPLTLI